MAETPAGDFCGWRAAYDFEPWGEERADVRAAVGHQIADAAARKGKSRPLKDYMPFYRAAKPKRQPPADPAAGRKIWASLANIWKRARERNKAATKGRKRKAEGGKPKGASHR
jgi:hypothetical protein